MMSHTTLAQGVCARHLIHVSCACVSGLSSTLHFALFTVSLIFYFILLIFHVIFYVGRFGVKPPVRFLERRVWPFGQQRVNTTTSHVHFRSVNLYKEFSYKLKVNKLDILTTSELVSRPQNDKPNTVWSDLKHLGICERSSDANRHEGITHWSPFVVSVLSSVVTVPWLFFFVQMTSHCIGSSLSPHSFHVSSHLHGSCALLCVSLIASTSPFTSSSSSSSLWSPCCSFCPSASSSRMWWTNHLCNSAEDLGTLAENEPPTGYEPNDHFITEVYVEYTQESTGEQRSPNDFDDDDVTIGKTLLDACRRRADHSEEEGLSSCLSSSVSHDRTERPVVCSFDSKVSSVQETQRHNSESEQIRILLERQREQILADCQAEIRKNEFQADYDRRSIQKLNEMIESQKKKFVVLIKETNDFDKINNFFMNSYWSKIGIFVKLIWKVSMRSKNWSDFKALHSTQLRGENWSKIEVLSLNSKARFRNYRIKLIVWMIQEIFKMLNQYAVDIPTIPVDLCLSHLIHFQVEC